MTKRKKTWLWILGGIIVGSIILNMVDVGSDETAPPPAVEVPQEQKQEEVKPQAKGASASMTISMPSTVPKDAEALLPLHQEHNKGLVWNAKLAVAAGDVASRASKRYPFCSHGDENPHYVDGTELTERVTAAGYSYSMVAENLACGQPTGGDAMESWLKSPGHRANVMNQGAKDLACARAGKWWACVFGAQ